MDWKSKPRTRGTYVLSRHFTSFVCVVIWVCPGKTWCIDIYDRPHTPSISVLLGQKRLRWVWHLIHMSSHRRARQILYGQLPVCQRSAKGQKKCYKDHLKTLLRKCNTNPTALESLAADHHRRSCTCHKGFIYFQRAGHSETLCTEGPVRCTATWLRTAVTPH